MGIQKNNSCNREVTKEDLLQALAVVAYGAIILFVYYNNHKFIPLLLLFSAGFLLISAIFSMPKETIEKLPEEIERRESMSIGKFVKYGNYFIQSLLIKVFDTSIKTAVRQAHGPERRRRAEKKQK